MALPFAKSNCKDDIRDDDNDPEDDDVVISAAATAATPLLLAMTSAAVAAAAVPSSRVFNADNKMTKKNKKNAPLCFWSKKQEWSSSSSFCTFFTLALVVMMMMMVILFVFGTRFLLMMGSETDDLMMFTTTTTTSNHHHHHHHHHPVTSAASSGGDDDGPAPAFSSSSEQENDCLYHIEPAQVQVPRNQPGFPSFWNYAAASPSTSQHHRQHPRPLHVTYDARSMLINGDRVLFLGGSMHPGVRATHATWDLALDQAVHNGLNLITIYVFWSAHQPFPNHPLDWTFFSSSSSSSSSSTCADHSDDDESSTCRSSWQLADAIRSCAARGLFVHLRIGPYACAEYTFGGIPEWLPLQYPPQMQMRRLETNWLRAMEGFLKATIDYAKANRLWAYQGGPIVMAQVENELGDVTGDFMQTHDSHDDEDDAETVHQRRQHLKQPPPTVQDYADWCGETVAKLSRNNDNGDIVWTMCNGLSANNTISTFNGDWLANRWLEQHGDTGRIQVDQPALWTEDEGGFQLWGEDSAHPSDYFWGNTARGMSKNALQWFARGGTHLNYYMWWGGYNRGRWAAAGILNAYATDAVLCPSGEPRQPKFGHFQALHVALAEIAPILLHASSALLKNQTIQVMNDDDGQWHVGTDQRMFVYRGSRHEDDDDDDTNKSRNNNSREVIFVENDQDATVKVKVPVTNVSVNGPAIVVVVLEMKPASSILMIDGVVRYDSGSIPPPAMAFTRRMIHNSVMLLNWTTWKEPVGATANHDRHWAHIGTQPMEQTTLNIMKDKVWSDYAWFTTTFTLEEDEDDLKMLRVDTDKANGIVVFLNGSYVDAADNHEHSEGNISHYLSLGDHPLMRGTYELSLLSESLGYFNLVGRWIQNTGAKRKGISGDVVLFSPSKLERNVSLVDGQRLWKSFAGLHVEREAVFQEASSSSPFAPTMRRQYLQKTLEEITTSTADASAKTATWSAASFKTPRYDPARQQLFLHTTTGRGHVWLNGHDLGRYWNITRIGREGETIHRYSQEYYFLPHDYLYSKGRTLNDIVFFDVFGGNHRECELVLSWIEASSDDDDGSTFKDEVDFPEACLL
jgi:Glycosyl hydrolases family 35